MSQSVSNRRFFVNFIPLLVAQMGHGILQLSLILFTLVLSSCMADVKSPRRRPTASRRRHISINTDALADDSVSAIAEPMARGSLCGHDGCIDSDSCNVRYVGAVSQIADHHMVKASHATSHIWPAAVISGLAVVLTGTIAYTSVQAASEQTNAANIAVVATREDIGQLIDRLQQLEISLQVVKQACTPVATLPAARLPQAANK